MEITNGLEQQLKTAELYQAQGLYEEAKRAFDAAIQIIKESPGLKNRENLLAALTRQVDKLAETSEKVESAPVTPTMAPQVQTLIKNLFATTAEGDPDITALEGAITLAKFGQVERAIFEFSALLEKNSVRMTAAKNILRCYHLLAAPEKAIDTYLQWLSGALFSAQELDHVRRFLEKLLEKSGTKIPVLTPSLTAIKITIDDSKPVVIDAPDIGSVVITLDNGPLQGKPIELDVQLQARNLVSLIIASKEKSILDNLSVGFRLKNIQFNSTVAIFRGEGVISAKALIDSGPKQGDYHLDIKIEDS